MDDMRTMYHYTDEEAVVDIQIDDKIKAGGGVFGYGVYLTSLPPSLGRKKIAENNYSKADEDQLWENREEEGSVDRAIELLIPRRKLHHVTSDRDIYIYGWNMGEGERGKDLILSAYMVGIHTLDWMDRIQDTDRFGAAYHT